MKPIIVFLLAGLSFCSIDGLWECKVSDSKYLIYHISETTENSGTYKFYKYYKNPDKKLRAKDSGEWLIIHEDICLLNDEGGDTYCGELKFKPKKDVLILEDRERYVFKRVKK
tara:strand:+ start:48 stop:386 length:339 start_codon:yes stop_codon:yes gene_type:complete